MAPRLPSAAGRQAVNPAGGDGPHDDRKEDIMDDYNPPIRFFEMLGIGEDELSQYSVRLNQSSDAWFDAPLERRQGRRQHTPAQSAAVHPARRP